MMLFAAGLAVLGCPPPLRPTPAPIPSERHATTRDNGSCTVVMLHGRGGRMGDFRKAGFVEAAERAGVPAELVSVHAHIGYYAKRSLVERLKNDVVQPALDAGRERVWLVGVSMGGLGALLYARLEPRGVAGVVLLSPFLGDEELIAEIRNAGGLRAWQPPADIDVELDYQRALWAWLKENAAAPDGVPIYLGYGADERFAPANALLADGLHAERVRIRAGGHTWSTWTPIWEQFVEAGFLCQR